MCLHVETHTILNVTVENGTISSARVLFLFHSTIFEKKKNSVRSAIIIMQPDSQTSIRACALDNGCGGQQNRSFVTVNDYMAARKPALRFNSSGI